MSKWLNNHSPLGRRLVTATIAFSTCVALLATALQLYFDYRTELQNIESTFQQVDTSYLPTVANALWSTNRHELQVAINGLVRLPDVRQVTVKENGKIWAQAGHPQTRNIELREYPLTFVHRGETLTIGTMTMVVDMESVYQRLVNKFWVILITNSIKTFLVAGFMLWLFHVLITRHLHRIAAFASRLDAGNLQEHLDLERHTSAHAAPDEFDAVLQGFSRMQSTLASSMSALRESEARFRVMFEQAAVGVAQIQSDTGKLLRVNQKFCEIVGYSSAELSQLPVQTMTYYEDLQREQGQLNMLKNGDISEYTLEQRYCRKDGALVWVSLTVAPMWLASGTLRYHVAVVQDITARKQAEAELQQFSASLERRVAERTAQLLALNQESEAFSYSVSHDLRAPLRSIDGFCQVLAEDYGKLLDEAGKTHLSRVRKAAQRMGVLIDDLLRLALIARAEITRTDIDLTQLAEEIINEFHVQAEACPITFTVQSGLNAYGDASLLRIVLENMLGNAVKYTRNASQPQIELGSMMLDGRNVFFVRDNGAGFDMAYAGKLFKAFERLHRSDDYPGTGVGLATVKRIVNRHGGEVWAEGRPGKGAVFYFTLDAPGCSDSEKLREAV
ncbi:MAG: PAS domain S-box protein [Gammaproteobacteria bacterium]|nr:PAS domain S-box protein [Gammaproteobacteria bacterium]